MNVVFVCLLFVGCCLLCGFIVGYWCCVVILLFVWGAYGMDCFNAVILVSWGLVLVIVFVRLIVFGLCCILVLCLVLVVASWTLVLPILVLFLF